MVPTNRRKFRAAKFRIRSAWRTILHSCFAGLWEGWKDPANDEWLRSCTIITGEPNDFVREIHTRMPVILPEEHHDAWLSGEAGKKVLVPYPADQRRRHRLQSRHDRTPFSPFSGWGLYRGEIRAPRRQCQQRGNSSAYEESRRDVRPRGFLSPCVHPGQ
jgi:hypothetical protein